jgi:hypothetical protein
MNTQSDDKTLDTEELKISTTQTLDCALIICWFCEKVGHRFCIWDWEDLWAEQKEW